jgi:hypothetical protein
LTGIVHSKADQLRKNLGLINTQRNKHVDDQTHHLLTTVQKNPELCKLLGISSSSTPYEYEPKNTTLTLLSDRTSQQSKHEAIVLSMLRLQNLRDAQLAFEGDGNKQNLADALFTPEIERCNAMLNLLTSLEEAAKKVKQGQECINTGNPYTSHSLVNVRETYNRRLLNAQNHVLRTSNINPRQLDTNIVPSSSLQHSPETSSTAAAAQ